MFVFTLLGSSKTVEKFVTRGYKHVGMRLAYFACPYPYAFVKRKRPRDANFFYGFTETKKELQTLATNYQLIYSPKSAILKLKRH